VQRYATKQSRLVASRRVGPCELSIMLLSDSATAVSRTCTSESRVQRSNHYFFYIITARRFASTVYAVVSCPSVRLSQAGIVSKRPDESSWFWHGDFLPPIPHCYKEIWVSPKIRALSTGTLSQTPDLENVAAARRSRCQQHSLSSSTVESVDDTYTTINESWLFTTNRSTVTLKLHYFDLLYKLFLQLTRFRLT